MSDLDVIIVGGGWAGLAAATVLTPNKKIILYERAGELGGRASSFYDEEFGEWLDNGPHIFVGAYRESMKLLEKWHSYDWYKRRKWKLRQRWADVSDISFDQSGEIPWIYPGGRIIPLKLGGVINSAVELLRFKGMSGKERMRTVKAMRVLTQEHPSLALSIKERGGIEKIVDFQKVDQLLQYPTVEQFLRRYGIEPGSCGGLWDALSVAIMNAPTSAADVRPFAKALREWLRSGKDASRIVLMDKPFKQFYCDLAEQWLVPPDPLQEEYDKLCKLADDVGVPRPKKEGLRISSDNLFDTMCEIADAVGEPRPERPKSPFDIIGDLSEALGKPRAENKRPTVTYADLTRHNVQICKGTPVKELVIDSSGRVVGVRVGSGFQRVVTSDGMEIPLDTDIVRAKAVILAVPPHEVLRLLPEKWRNHAYFSRFSRFQYSPIASVHINFDRVVCPVRFGLFPGAFTHWVFGRGASQSDGWRNVTAIISAAPSKSEMTNDQIAERVIADLRDRLPQAVDAKVEATRVIRTVRATVLLTPDSTNLRPDLDRFWHSDERKIPVQGLYLAGDWCHTGLPATIESAVRSGVAAGKETGSFLEQLKERNVDD
ncbi:MAG: FAD-dependent oxidoreductase [Candidatus Electryoneaceae bacterium]|nr:FAD-dependent oxidoreductase [Candidatus Electryoneaceae bacterium]